MKFWSALHLPHYFSKHPSRNLVELYWSVGIMAIANSAITIFEPIFLYTLGYSVTRIILFYLIVYATCVFILPIFGRLVGRLGCEHSIFISQFFLIAYYLALFGISRFPGLFFVAPFIFAIQKSLYWPAYHADFALFSRDEQRGREIGTVETLNTILYIVGPFIGGAILQWTNFGVLFAVIAVLYILSAIPLLRIREAHEPFTFSYSGAFKELWDRPHRRNFLAYLGFGEELIVLMLWPIFIYIVVKDYLEIGALVAVATLVTGFLVLFIGRAVDKYRKERVLRFGSIMYSIVWLLRVAASQVWHILLLDTGSRISKETLIVPLVTTTYNNARKMGVLPYMVFYEQSLAVAKAVTAILLLIILQFVSNPWPPIFIVAAMFSLFYMFLKEN